MHITILTVGENKFPFLKTGETLYLKRLSHYTTIQLESVPPEKITKSSTESMILKHEADHLRSKIDNNAFVCVLDRSGKMLSSEAFAQQIQGWQNRSISKVVFCVGGPLGLDPHFIKQADFRLSLSTMTFPHDLVRVVFLEQLYRAFTILKGEKYHK